jgi:hypothetical protein
MQFTSEVVVERSRSQVAAFFAEPNNLAKWDRSVAQVIPTAEGTAAVGFTFDTIAPSRLRMSYRITDHVPEESTSVALESSPKFRDAIWYNDLRARPDRHAHPMRRQLHAAAALLVTDHSTPAHAAQRPAPRPNLTQECHRSQPEHRRLTRSMPRW